MFLSVYFTVRDNIDLIVLKNQGMHSQISTENKMRFWVLDPAQVWKMLRFTQWCSIFHRVRIYCFFHVQKKNVYGKNIYI
jgi:hypothetical protein